MDPLVMSSSIEQLSPLGSADLGFAPRSASFPSTADASVIFPETSARTAVKENVCRDPMRVHCERGNLVALDTTVLSDVPLGVIMTPDTGPSCANGCFIGKKFEESKSRHVFKMGSLRGLRFMCCFRFKLWWMTQKVGDAGRDIPLETQFLLVESKRQQPRSGTSSGADMQREVYTVFLPLLDGSFRAALQGGGEDDAVEVVLESGDPAVAMDQSLHAVYVHSGTNPFKVISDAVRAVEEHSGSFLRREKKRLPGLLDHFGWCTWDAFYIDVSAEDVDKGLESLSAGGTPPRFLIIDDGWQSVAADPKEEEREGPAAIPAVTVGTQYASRLTTIKANDKFQRKKPRTEEEQVVALQAPEEVVEVDKEGEVVLVAADRTRSSVPGGGGAGAAGTGSAAEAVAALEAIVLHQQPPRCSQQLEELHHAADLGHVVREAKAKHRLKYVYVWHALMGYWGGVQPGASGMEHYESSMVFPVHTPAILGNQPDMADDSLTLHGLGVVSPEKIAAFYDELHGYLASCGVDGVKVDVQNILETLGAGFGGRVRLAKAYHQALEASVAKNFPDNGVISCMSHSTDGLYSAKQTAVIRASDDFWPNDPASHTSHIVAVAYNSLFLGEFMQPDWDMFHSVHPAADFHGAARAIGGCAVYVSDKPGAHNFDLLRKLVLPDGSVLRCLLPARPTADSLFVDPARDHASMLKIWNVNKYGGVVGAFNCQGAGWCREGHKYAVHNEAPPDVIGSISAADVSSIDELAPQDWSGETAVYSHRAGELVRLPPSSSLLLVLPAMHFELYTLAPLVSLSSSTASTPLLFAPIGLSSMFNSGGAILWFKWEEEKQEEGEKEVLTRSSTSNDERLPTAAAANKAGMHPAVASSLEGGDAAAAAVEHAVAARGTVHLRIKGGGTFLAFSSLSPRECLVVGQSVPFLFGEGRLEFGVEFDAGAVGGAQPVEVRF